MGCQESRERVQFEGTRVIKLFRYIMKKINSRMVRCKDFFPKSFPDPNNPNGERLIKFGPVDSNGEPTTVTVQEARKFLKEEAKRALEEEEEIKRERKAARENLKILRSNNSK